MIWYSQVVCWRLFLPKKPLFPPSPLQIAIFFKKRRKKKQKNFGAYEKSTKFAAEKV